MKVNNEDPTAGTAVTVVKNGEHRRNVVTRGISLKTLRRGEWFRVGEVVFEYRGPRSVCRYIERLTEPAVKIGSKSESQVRSAPVLLALRSYL
jgi:MOSC domain-containing protein YiiM